MTDQKTAPFLSSVSREARARITTETAFAIAQEEKSARDKKMARLRELRLAQKPTPTPK
jgi:hypothetical protein